MRPGSSSTNSNKVSTEQVTEQSLNSIIVYSNHNDVFDYVATAQEAQLVWRRHQRQLHENVDQEIRKSRQTAGRERDHVAEAFVFHPDSRPASFVFLHSDARTVGRSTGADHDVRPLFQLPCRESDARRRLVHTGQRTNDDDDDGRQEDDIGLHVVVDELASIPQESR